MRYNNKRVNSFEFNEFGDKEYLRYKNNKEEERRKEEEVKNYNW